LYAWYQSLQASGLPNKIEFPAIPEKPTATVPAPVEPEFTATLPPTATQTRLPTASLAPILTPIPTDRPPKPGETRPQDTGKFTGQMQVWLNPEYDHYGFIDPAQDMQKAVQDWLLESLVEGGTYQSKEQALADLIARNGQLPPNLKCPTVAPNEYTQWISCPPSAHIREIELRLETRGNNPDKVIPANPGNEAGGLGLAFGPDGHLIVYYASFLPKLEVIAAMKKYPTYPRAFEESAELMIKGSSYLLSFQGKSSAATKAVILLNKSYAEARRVQVFSLDQAVIDPQLSNN